MSSKKHKTSIKHLRKLVAEIIVNPTHSPYYLSTAMSDTNHFMSPPLIYYYLKLLNLNTAKQRVELSNKFRTLISNREKLNKG